jgi:hypothetical protein
MFRRLLPVVVACWFAVAGVASADAVRYRFVPDGTGALVQVPAGPDGAMGELLRAGRSRPFHRVFRPNQMVTVVHSYTGRTVTVPLTLPEDTPRLEHRTDRIVYNYGSYVVEIRFRTDGAVETVYDSGFLRPLQVQ